MIDGKAKEVTRLFDTNTATKICDVVNAFKYKVQEIYITKKELYFSQYKWEHVRGAKPKEVKKWIGENEPDKYIKYFGEVEEG